MDSPLLRRRVLCPAAVISVSAGRVLVATLLEPESDDGLIAWNYFDKDLAAGGFGGGPSGFPICKLMKPAVLVKDTIR